MSHLFIADPCKENNTIRYSVFSRRNEELVLNKIRYYVIN